MAILSEFQAQLAPLQRNKQGLTHGLRPEVFRILKGAQLHSRSAALILAGLRAGLFYS